jgi:hypothetical protein
MDYDITVSMLNSDEYPVVTAHSEAGEKFLGRVRRAYITSTVEEFIAYIPPSLRVGLLNPETNLFAQLPPRSLH